jgi:hypothetical protein
MQALCHHGVRTWLMSQTRMDLSSELETMSSRLGWKSTHETLLVCPVMVCTSHACSSSSKQMMPNELA